MRRSLSAWAFLTHLLLMMPVGTNLTEWWIESNFFCLLLQTHQCIKIIQQHDDKVCSQTNGIWVSTELIHIFCVWSTLTLAGFNSRQLFKANTERTSLSFYLTKNKQDQWKYFWFDKQKNIKATSTVSKIHIVMQCFRVVYYGISHESLVFSQYTDEPLGKCVYKENRSDKWDIQ